MLPQSYTIARLASAAEVHVETIRYYQRRGLIPEPPRPAGGVRRYTVADADRLRFIKRAQAMGFTLTEISNLLRLRSRRSCRATRELAAAKLRVIDDRIRELRHLRKELAQLVAACDANAEETHCPVIERLTVQPGTKNSLQPFQQLLEALRCLVIRSSATNNDAAARWLHTPPHRTRE